jgi:hypothetical protein
MVVSGDRLLLAVGKMVWSDDTIIASSMVVVPPYHHHACITLTLPISILKIGTALKSNFETILH